MGNRLTRAYFNRQVSETTSSMPHLIGISSSPSTDQLVFTGEVAALVAQVRLRRLWLSRPAPRLRRGLPHPPMA
jgi:hypothetical protein